MGCYHSNRTSALNQMALRMFSVWIPTCPFPATMCTSTATHPSRAIQYSFTTNIKSSNIACCGNWPNESGDSKPGRWRACIWPNDGGWSTSKKILRRYWQAVWAVEHLEFICCKLVWDPNQVLAQILWGQERFKIRCVERHQGWMRNRKVNIIYGLWGKYCYLLAGT